MLLALFIAAGSAGRWSPYEPGVWAPTLIKPADVVRNVLLYVPFGFFGLVVMRRSDARGVGRVVLIAILFSAANEALQLYTADRVASLTDIVSAAAGTSAGAGVASWVLRPR